MRSGSRSEFGRNAIWFTALSALDRVIAVVQTVLISRALGITEYGVYGLLFGTIGFVASVVGMQMGLTATVFVARYRIADKAKAAAVISIVQRFGWIVAATFVVMTVPVSQTISSLLVGSSVYQLPTMLGLIFVGASILSGVQDGVAQGFEIFGALAKLKIGASLIVLALVYPIANLFGLSGVLLLVLAGLVLKILMLRIVVRRSRADANLPRVGSGISFRALISDFAFPSMIVSLVIGFVSWLGMFMLSKQTAGFDGVAIVNTGMQWRGPALLLAASLGGVAIPAFSRLTAHRDAANSSRLRRTLAFFNLGVASAVAIGVIACSGLIMQLYGEGFTDGRLAFSMIVLSTVPTVVANVYMQELVGNARMWRQLWLHCPFVGTLGAAFLLLVPSHHALGYALSLLLGSIVLLGTVLIANQMGGRGDVKSGAG